LYFSYQNFVADSCFLRATWPVHSPLLGSADNPD